MRVWEYILNIFSNLGEAISNGLGRFIPDWAVYLIMALIGIILIIVVILLVVLVLIYFERRGIGRFQVRPGPNRAGPFGILQPICDVIKLFVKEDIIPSMGDRWVHWIAPVIVLVPALLVFAVVPFGKGAIFVDLNIGILYIIAIGSLGIIGIFMAGWASSNKYSLVAAMRAVAQLISYEIPMVLSIVGVVLVVGSLSMADIVKEQSLPFILLQPLGFLVYFLGATAELNRSPMDLMEAESELTTGYHVEYSGMKWALFFLAEFGNTFAVAAIATTLFLGGWKAPVLFGWNGLAQVPSYVWFMGKVLLVYFVLLWMRSTLPRLRVDQLMGFAWKFLFPLALINILIIAIEVLLVTEYNWSLWPMVLVNIVIAGFLVILWSQLFFKPGGGRVEV